MNTHISNARRHTNASTRGRHRSKRTGSNIWLVLFIGIFLALMIGLIIRFIMLERWNNPPLNSNETGKNETNFISFPDSVSVNPIIRALGTTPSPNEFVNGLENSGLTVSYESPPDFHIQGKQTVRLSFSGNTGNTIVETELYLFNLINQISVTVGHNDIIDVSSFVPDPNVDATFIGLSPAQINMQKGGIFDLTIRCNGTDYPVSFVVKENTPPSAVGLQITSPIGILPPAESLVTDIYDQSDVTVSYLNQPDTTLLGVQNVIAVVEDIFGNACEVAATIEFTPAENGPRFSGLDELHIQVGGTISYKSGVSAYDPEDGELTFAVDPGNVDTKTIGTYTAVYSAQDSSGNQITAHRTIVVQDEAASAVEAYVQDILTELIKNDMSVDQKIHKIYSYTRSNIRFVGSSDKTSIVHSAYEGFSTGKGDCYTYYAVNKVLLDALGIPNLEVRRIEGTSNHWWNLVLHEDGVYYHVDSCPKAIYLDGIKYYRMTDTDLDTYTYHDDVFAHRPNYYTYDKTLPEYQDITIAP